jgi:hypothetical protein
VERVSDRRLYPDLLHRMSLPDTVRRVEAALEADNQVERGGVPISVITRKRLECLPPEGLRPGLGAPSAAPGVAPSSGPRRSSSSKNSMGPCSSCLRFSSALCGA